MDNLLYNPELLEEFNYSCSKILDYRIQTLFPELKEKFILLKPPYSKINWKLAVIYKSAEKGYDKVFEECFNYTSDITVSSLFYNLFISGSIKILDIMEKRIPKHLFKKTFISLEQLVKHNNWDLTIELLIRDYPLDYNELAMWACVHDNLKFFKEFGEDFIDDLDSRDAFLETVYKHDSINIYNYLVGNEKDDKYYPPFALAYSKPEKFEIVKKMLEKSRDNLPLILHSAGLYNKGYIIDYAAQLTAPLYQ